MKVTFTMANPQPKKHSTRFDFERLEDHTIPVGTSIPDSFRPSFYIPEPFMNAKRIRVTIEEV